MTMVDNYLAVTQQLPKCASRNEVEALFDSNEIRDPLERKKFLFNAMGFDDSFNADDGQEISAEQQYETELAIFVEGTWRLYS